MASVTQRLRYRVLTGPDDAEFCRRVSLALDEGYELHGSPAITHDGKQTIVAQAVVLPPYAASSLRPTPASAAPIPDPPEPRPVDTTKTAESRPAAQTPQGHQIDEATSGQLGQQAHSVPTGPTPQPRRPQPRPSSPVSEAKPRHAADDS